MIFTYIKAEKFFPKYANTVTNWRHKLAGKNGRGAPLSFTEEDNKAIQKGIKKLFKDITT